MANDLITPDENSLQRENECGRDNARPSSGRTIFYNFSCYCHVPGCEFKTASSKDVFCAKHHRLNQLIPVLYGDQGTPHVQHRSPLTAVYLVGSRKAGAIKIGVADSVVDRVATLQTGSPFKIDIFGAIYTLRDHAFRIERACHDKLREFDFHLSGEWFDAEPEDAYKLMAKMANDLQLAWITPGTYATMIGSDEYLTAVSHYTADVFKVRKAMMLDGLTPSGK